MEQTLQTLANEVLNNDKVVGYLCSDDRGLCLAASGIGDKAFCPMMVRISQIAEKLDESKKDSLVIGIDTDENKILIKSHGKTTSAIYKKY